MTDEQRLAAARQLLRAGAHMRRTPLRPYTEGVRLIGEEMAKPNLVQRGLRNLGSTARAVRTGEGDGKAAKLGKAARKGLKKAKAGMDNLAATLGFGGIQADAYEEEPEEHRRRKAARMIFAEDAPVFVQRDGTDGRDLATTVAPEFRAQVSAGLAAANTMTAGSTLVDGGGGGGGSKDDW
jgi:hypothetical protein